MYDIKQFRPTLYLVVMIGITGFCMAAEMPGLWVFAMAMLLTSAWLIRQKQYRPAPRWLTAVISIIGFAYTYLEVTRFRSGSPIVAVGEFLVVLQIVKTWEQRANRDFAQLLVLSLLLMVSAAISTYSLGFGILFLIYLLLSLYCCLLFHLKVETDEAKAAMSTTAARLGEGSLRQDQRHLARSMRRLTGLVACYAFVAAVLVFLLFPRNTGAGMFGQFQWRPKNTLTGFSEEVSFQQVAKISQNDDVVGTIKIWKDDVLQGPAGTILLRGTTHSYYNGNDTSDHAPYQWTHARLAGNFSQSYGEDMTDDNNNGVWTPAQTDSDGLRLRSWSQPVAHLKQEIQLNPTGTPVLFALAGAISVKPEEIGSMRRLPLRYASWDQTIRVSDALTQPIRYQVQSTGSLGDEPSPDRQRSVIDPKIAEFARLPDVTQGLAQRRDAEVARRNDRGLYYVSPLDEQIASDIERYLRQNFKYTLDLTDREIIAGRDPMVAFLYDFKKGHCEYFAGAMTLMCQSLGMDARLVIGFKCDDYNAFGHFYTIRQSHAHAWVEVRTTDGWKTFDPTSGNVDSSVATSAWSQTKRFFDFLEYSWQNSVINYNSENRENLIQNAENTLNQTAVKSSQSLNGFKDAMDTIGTALASKIVGPLIAVLALAIVGAVGWFLAERLKLHRRAARIGIVDLPLSEQAKLMRQLGFYDDMIRLLARHRIVRPQHLTQLEFCDSLSFLPTEAYDTIHRVTRLFYRIRYGEAELDAGQQRRLTNVIDRLSSHMPTSGGE